MDVKLEELKAQCNALNEQLDVVQEQIKALTFPKCEDRTIEVPVKAVLYLRRIMHHDHNEKWVVRACRPPTTNDAQEVIDQMDVDAIGEG